MAGLRSRASARSLETAFAGACRIRGASTCGGFSSATDAQAFDSVDAGRPLGLDDFVFRDVDAALDIARRHNIRDHVRAARFSLVRCRRAPSTACRWAGALRRPADSGNRDALLDACFARCSSDTDSEPAIFAWDIINEPEWITTVEPARSRCVSQRERRVDSREHEASGHRRIRRCAMAGSVRRASDLDFYQVHWYDGLKHQPRWTRLSRDSGSIGRCCLGEYPTRGSKRRRRTIVAAARGGRIFRRVLLVGVGEGRVLSRVYMQDPAYAGPPTRQPRWGAGA